MTNFKYPAQGKQALSTCSAGITSILRISNESKRYECHVMFLKVSPQIKIPGNSQVLDHRVLSKCRIGPHFWTSRRQVLHWMIRLPLPRDVYSVIC